MFHVMGGDPFRAADAAGRRFVKVKSWLQEKVA
jgi:hypothetical protein